MQPRCLRAFFRLFDFPLALTLPLRKMTYVIDIAGNFF
jgi:hypothetical protein